MLFEGRRRNKSNEWVQRSLDILFQPPGVGSNVDVVNVVDQRILLREKFRFSTEIEPIHVLVPITFEAPNVEFDIWTKSVKNFAEYVKSKTKNVDKEDLRE